MGFVVITLFLLGVAVGMYTGYVLAHDHAEKLTLEARPAARLPRHAIPPPRHAVTQPLRLIPRDPPTGELLAIYAAETIRFPVPERSALR